MYTALSFLNFLFENLIISKSILFLGAVIKKCTDFGVCSGDCGTQTCTNTCVGGTWGDEGCEEAEKIRSIDCNLAACRKLIRF